MAGAPAAGPLAALIRFFLEQKVVVLILLAAILGWGAAVAPFDWDTGPVPRDPVPVDAIPNLGENQQIVFTEWPGRSPQDVEDQVTYPLTVSLMGAPGVSEVRSQSAFGFSMIFLIFEEDVEFYWSRSRIIEKLGSLPAGLLPADAKPSLGPDATALGQVFWYTLEGRDPDGNPTGGWDLEELRSIQDWYVRYGLLSAGGVSEVASIGGYQKEYQVDVNPDALRAHDVSLEQVFNAVRKSNLDVGARVTEINRAEYLVRSRGFIENLEDIEQAVVRVGEGNTPLHVKDVADVHFGPAQRRGALTIEGAEAVGGVVVAREGYNPLAAIENVKKEIGKIAPGLPEKAVVDWEKTSSENVDNFAEEQGLPEYASDEEAREAWVKWLRETPRGEWPEWMTLSKVSIESFYDRSNLIMETLATLNKALADEILVTIIVLMVILVHLRSALLVSAMLPLAVLITFIAMKLGGVEANVVALSGIAIAIGAIVDMGIIVTENILKHLDAADPEENRLEVVCRGASEVGSAVLTAAATIVISFLPVFTMTGAEGKLFVPLAFTKTFAMVAAAILALLVMPAAAHVVLGGRIRARALRRGLLAALVLIGAVAVGFGVRWDFSVIW
ncbi:MAG: efflux RND transporter permease subunit, partial [Opitutales bacterium]